MRVAVGFDHAGFPLKETVLEEVRRAGHEPVDVGAFTLEPGDDYPDYAQKLGEAIRSGRAERGILVCGSGIGASIAANKMQGIYASVAHEDYSASQGVQHDDMNVLCLGARVIGDEIAKMAIGAFLGAHFSPEERHHRRVGKIHAIEAADLIGGKKS